MTFKKRNIAINLVANVRSVEGLILVMFYKVSGFCCNDLSEMESLVEALALLPGVLCFPEYQCQVPFSNGFFVSSKNISLPFLDKSQHRKNLKNSSTQSLEFAIVYQLKKRVYVA